MIGYNHHTIILKLNKTRSEPSGITIISQLFLVMRSQNKSKQNLDLTTIFWEDYIISYTVINLLNANGNIKNDKVSRWNLIAFISHNW